MNKFERISNEQFAKDFAELNEKLHIPTAYEDIKLPARATKNSAGYDLFAPFEIHLSVGETVKIPTGIRVFLDDDKFLAIVPRSGLGFKYRLQLDNTIGIIDADYSGSSNEGHIWAKITNDGHEGKEVVIKKGDAFAQGIILPYFKTVDDNSNEIRDGGFGSTTK